MVAISALLRFCLAWGCRAGRNRDGRRAESAAKASPSQSEGEAEAGTAREPGSQGARENAIDRRSRNQPVATKHKKEAEMDKEGGK